MSSTLFAGGLVRTLDGDGVADWVLVEDRVIVGTGPRDDLPDADRIIYLDGMTLVPAFCDGHVHLPATGLYEAGLDFRGEASAATILDAYRGRAEKGPWMIFGGNFEDPLDRPLSRRDLDAAVGERHALLARADMHSCIVSTTLLRELDVSGLEGVDVVDGVPTGYLREKAAATAWRWFDANLPRDQAKDAIKAAVRRAYSKGVGSVNEMHVVEWRGWESLHVLRDVAREVALDIRPCVAIADVAAIRELDLPRIGGDWFLDGSFGSHTAWLTEPYDPPPPPGSPPAGIAYRTDREVLEFFTAAQTAGLQAGVHAIGDAAIEQAIAAWEAVANRAGVEAVRAPRHRIEHFECASDDHIARAAHLGLAASVQPAFDHYWGGEDGLYARRMGWERASTMNRFKSMIDAGLVVGAGSDSTVTPLDPFLQMASLRAHHLPSERIDGVTALRLHTAGSQALTCSEQELGTLAPGMGADMALLDRDPVESDVDSLLASEVAGTWVGGVRVWPPEAAEGE
ncbi:MAG: amidohydrolase [Actinomycetota bacterium]